MGHDHGATRLDIDVDERVRRYMWAAVAVCAVGVVIGMIVLWPGRSDSGADPLGLDGDPITARVTSQAIEPCSYDPYWDAGKSNSCLNPAPMSASA
jgi:hypothetical protein